MTERKYSVSEIESMRYHIRKLLMPMVGQPFYQHDLDAQTESQLQTYLLSGIGPEELEKAASERMAWEQKWILNQRDSSLRKEK